MNKEPKVPAHIISVLKNVLENESLCLKSYKTSVGSGKGDNLAGEIIRVDARVENEKENKTLTKQFIIKIAPTTEKFRGNTPINLCFSREVFMYEKVLRSYENLQRTKNIKHVFDNYPKCYAFSLKNFCEFIIMNDKISDGFSRVQRSEPLNFQHCLTVLRSLAKLHALSFALKDQNPEIFKHFADNCDNIHRKLFPSESEFKRILTLFADKTAKSLVENSKVHERFENLRRNVCEEYDKLAQLTDDYSVLSHGDSWITNILFKYKGSNTESPVDVCFLDWQLSRYGSVAYDIGFFLMNCTVSEVRDKYFDELLNDYYNTLSNFLTQLGSDPKILFPRKELDNQIKKYYKYPLIVCLMTIFLVATIPEEMPDFVEEGSWSLIEYDGNVKLYNQRVSGVIKDAVNRGIL